MEWREDPESLLADPSIDLVATAAVPDRRAAIAISAVRSGKDVVTDKPGCMTLNELADLEKAVAESGRFWSVTFSERFEVRCAVKAGDLVRAGRIGRVVQTLGLGPHREGDRADLAGGEGRPDWFYDRERTGGILTDIASRQVDQFLFYTGSETAEVVASTVANYTHPDSPGMQDFGPADGRRSRFVEPPRLRSPTVVLLAIVDSHLVSNSASVLVRGLFRRGLFGWLGDRGRPAPVRQGPRRALGDSAGIEGFINSPIYRP